MKRVAVLLLGLGLSCGGERDQVFYVAPTIGVSHPLDSKQRKLHHESTGHKSLTMVRRYIREGSLFRENAATKLGL